MAAAEQILTFEVAGKALGIPTSMVAEVVPTPRITRVPQAPVSLTGLANLRGRVTPIVSLAAVLAAETTASPSRVIVLDRRDPVGLAVDRIVAMETIEGGEHDAGSVVRTAQGNTTLINLDELLARAFSGIPSRSDAEQAAPAPAPVAAAKADERAFLRFELAGQVYALPLAQVREVIAPPDDLVALPQREALMLGVTPLRGALLGLVSLSALLGLPSPGITPRSRVVVAALGDTSVGLLVDHVRSILRASEDAIGEVPAILNRGAGEAQIDAIVRTPDGLVSVLSADRIFLDSTVAEVAERGDRASGRDADNKGADRMEQFVIFRLGSETYGLPIASVAEIVRLPAQVTPAPRAPAFVAGIMNHRGVVVPLIDQRSRFEARGDDDSRARRVIIARVDDLAAGFIVDAVESVLDVSAEALRATPGLVSGEAPIFDRVATFEHDGRLILLMDPRRLLDQTERDVLKGLAAQSQSAPT